MAPSTATAVCPEMKKSLTTLYVTSREGKSGLRQIIPDAAGKAHSARHNCRKANRIRRAINGRSVGPKMPVPIRKSPKRSMKAELMMRVAFVKI